LADLSKWENPYPILLNNIIGKVRVIILVGKKYIRLHNFEGVLLGKVPGEDLGEIIIDNDTGKFVRLSGF
jgi:hypothetical protein